MTKRPSTTKPSVRAEREKRLAEALRANLKRRKAAAQPLPADKKSAPKPGTGDLE